MKQFNVKNFRTAFHKMPSPNTNVRVIVNAGAADEAEDAHGVAHFLEHMFFKGTTERDYKAINKATSRLGDINAYTSRYQTVYHFTFPSTDFEEATKVLFEMVFKPAFPEEEFKREIGVILQECQSGLDSPQRFFSNQITEHIWGNKTGHPVIGTMDSIASMTLDKMKQFVDQYYNASNMLVAITGNVEEDVVKTVLEKLLPESQGEETRRLRPERNFDNYSFHHKSTQAIIGLAVPGIPAKQELERNSLPDVFFNGLGGGMHSLLFDRLREELGLCYSVGGYHGSGKDTGMGMIFTMLDEKNIDLAKREIERIIQNVCRHGFDDELLDIAKRNYLFSMARRLETANGINSFADEFFTINGYPLSDLISYEKRRAAVNSITNEQIVSFANEIFGDGKPRKFLQMTHRE